MINRYEKQQMAWDYCKYVHTISRGVLGKDPNTPIGAPWLMRPLHGAVYKVTFQTCKPSWLVRILSDVIVIQLLGSQVYIKGSNFYLLPASRPID